MTNVNGVESGSVTSERPDESTSLSTTSSVVSESDGEMDTTSSDGGSIVRELNDQVTSGNTGNVDGIDESYMSRNMDSTDVDVEWNTVSNRKRKKSRSSAVSPS